MSTQPNSSGAHEASGVQLSNSKERASRIPTNYYRNRNPMERWKMLSALGATVLTVVWLAWGFAADSGLPSPSWIEDRYSHGPLCKAHQRDREGNPLESNCSACHVSFPVLGGESAKERADGKCYECHKSLGTAKETHWPYQSYATTPSCGACHRDHRGVDVDLKVMADSYCIGCHGKIENHVSDKKMLGSYKAKDFAAVKFFKKDEKGKLVRKKGKLVRIKIDPAKKYPSGDITDFAKSHPEFLWIRAEKDGAQDPGAIRFSHEFHLQAGLYGSVEEIPDANQRGKYERYQNAKGEFQLNCNACHAAQRVGDVNTEIRSTDALGVLPLEKDQAYYLPIDYAAHCSACHPMPKPLGYTEPLKHGHRTDPETKKRVKIPPDVIAKEVEKQLSTVGINAFRTALPFIPRSLPGKAPRSLRSDDSDDKVEKELRAKVLNQTLNALFNKGGVCNKCHYGYNEAGGLAPLTRDSTEVANAWGKGKNGPAIPRIWFRHAEFNHKEHEFMRKDENDLGWCVKCHSGTEPPKGAVSFAAVDNFATRDGAAKIMMPGKASCAQCHTPTPASIPAGDKENAMFRVEKTKAARHDCTECHLYHHGKH